MILPRIKLGVGEKVKDAVVLLHIARNKMMKRETFFLKFSDSGNVGDVISHYLYERISGKKAPLNVGYVNRFRQPNFMITGSILQFADEESVIWGTGFAKAGLGIGNKGWSSLKIKENKEKPRKICAVRGPLTRQCLMKKNIPCPAVFGDPALLMPNFYNPPVPVKKYRLGVVAHFSYRESPNFFDLRNQSDVFFISVFDPPEKFVDQMLACKFIASSSLHGLILADAYKLPSIWIQPADKACVDTSFKFIDYMSTTDSIQKEPLILTQETTQKDIVSFCRLRKSKVDLLELLLSCPFIG